MEVQKIPSTLTVDPNHHLFRRLYPEEVIPGLNALLEDREKILVVPEKSDEESRKIYVELAGMTQKMKGGKIVSEKDLTEEEVQNASLMVLGDSWKNPLLARIISALPPSLLSKDGKSQVDGDSLNEGDESILLTQSYPGRSGRWVTLYFGASATALTRAPYIFFYGWDSYLLFKKGRPAKRGDFPPLRSLVTHSFLPSKEHSGSVPSP